jgi:hypothetical protein
MKKHLKSVVSYTAWGVVFCVGALWFWHYLVGNPFDELELIRRGHTVPGFIVDTWEEVESGDEGGTHWLHGALYTYRMPDGQEFTQRTKESSGRLKPELQDLTQPVPIEVEYLPDNPAVSRIKGDGSPNLFDWLWRKIGLGTLLLALFLAPGLGMLRTAIRDFKQHKRTLKQQSS